MPTSSTHVGGSVSRSVSRAWITAILTCLIVSTALHPISNDDFWWQLSRGRAVLKGATSPSGQLLAGDRLAEADWLGGVPFYLLYQVGGFSALMLSKLAISIGLAIWCCRQTEALSPVARQLSTIAIVLVASVACEPSPILWDIWGLILSSALVQRLDSSGRPWFTRLQLGLLACTWANLAPGCVLILLPLVTAALHEPVTNAKSDSRRWPRGLWWEFVFVLAGLCLTPRGLFTISDSVRQLVPLIVASPAILNDSPWLPLWLGPVDGVAIGWLILSLMVVVSVVRRKPIRYGNWVLVALVISLGTWFRPNAPVLAIWLVQWLANSANCVSSTNLASPRKLVQWSIAGASLLLAAASCLGLSPLMPSRLGWGLGRQLEHRLFAESLQPAVAGRASRNDPNESAHCMDIRSAGMLAWQGAGQDWRPSVGRFGGVGRPAPNTGHPRPYLVLQRALVNGQLREEVLLNLELQTGWLKQHRRSDGTDGGWWLTLRGRQAGVLVTSADNVRLIESLQPTIWKPLTIDSPVIPFALAGDPRYQPRILEVASQLDFVDRGSWTYQPESASGSDILFDLTGWLTGWADPDSILRQSSVLRAMNQPLAAMRVLHPLLPISPVFRKARGELIACQLELARREFLTCGEIGEFRRQVLARLGAVPSFAAATQTPMSEPPAIPPQAIDLYLSGKPHAAAEILQKQSPAALSARAMLEWEAGRLDEAVAAWTRLQQQFPDSRFALAGRYALEMASY